MSDIEIAIKARDREIRRLTKETDKLKSSLGGLGPAAKVAAGALGAIGLVQLGRGIVNTIRTFEDLRATLVTIEGDASKAAQSFDLIRQFTAGTPFQLEEVTQAFITFRNAGLVPTTDFMTNVGNIAAGMGQRIDSVARAVFNATTGEFEMLKQLGIKVKTEGDKLTVNFKGTARTIDNDGRAIVKLINEIGRSEFAGGIERQSATLTGSLSNLQDNFAEIANAIGEGGLTSAITTVTQDFITFTGENKELAHALGKTLGDAILLVRDNLDILKAVMVAVGVGAFIKIIGALTVQFRLLTAAVIANATAIRRHPVVFAGAAIAGAFVYFKDKIFGTSEELEKNTEVVDKNAAANLDHNKVVKENTVSLFENTAQQKVNTKEKERAEKAAKKLVEQQRKALEEILLLNETELEQFARKEAEKQKELNDSLQNKSITYEEYLRGINELEEFYSGKRKAITDKEKEDAKKRAADAKKAQEDERQLAEDTIQGIRQGNLDFYKNKEVLEKNAAAVTIAQAKSTVDTLATQNKTFFNIQKAIKISEAIQNTYVAATRALTSLPPPFNFAAAALVTASGFAQVAAIRSQQYPGREMGGPVEGGRPYIVGEGGPELFVPGRSGTIVPNGASIGGQVTVNFNIQAIDTSDFDDLLLTRQDMIVGLINRAMRERGKRAITV